MTNPHPIHNGGNYSLASQTRAESELTQLERRELVQRMMLARMTQAAMAVEIGCSHKTITRDVEWVRENWKQRLAQRYDEWTMEELSKLDALEEALWPGAMSGKPHVVERVVQLMDHRAKLLGLYAPTRQKMQVVTDDLLDQMIEAERRKLEQLADARGAERRQAIGAGGAQG